MEVSQYISDFIERSKYHSHIYHFTDIGSAKSMQVNGILSRHELDHRKIVCAHRGGNGISIEADRRFGMDRYVHLSMTKDHPLLYYAAKDGRLPDPVNLGIDPIVLQLPGVKASIGVANKSDRIILDVEDALDKFDLDVIYNKSAWTDDTKERLKNARKCEFLVPKVVAWEYVRKVWKYR
jgi:ssDNA thymidine ADP-ribosyltransferase DarT-like protein